MALQLAFRSPRRLGGAFALSSYLCTETAVYERLRGSKAPNLPPVFMRHGASDDFILPEWGAATAQQLSELGVQVP